MNPILNDSGLIRDQEGPTTVFFKFGTGHDGASPKKYDLRENVPERVPYETRKQEFYDDITKWVKSEPGNNFVWVIDTYSYRMPTVTEKLEQGHTLPPVTESQPEVQEDTVECDCECENKQGGLADKWYYFVLLIVAILSILAIVLVGIYYNKKERIVYKTAPEDEVRAGEVVLTVGLTNGYVKIRSAIDMPAMPDHDSMNRAMGIALNTIANYQTELRKSIYMQPSLPLKTNETEKLQKALKEITELLKAP